MRNICAHHARLWNRDLNIVPERLSFSKRLAWISNPEMAKRSKIYYFLCMLNYMLQTANPTSPFKSRLKELLKDYEGIISLNTMGLLANWNDETEKKTLPLQYLIRLVVETKTEAQRLLQTKFKV